MKVTTVTWDQWCGKHIQFHTILSYRHEADSRKNVGRIVSWSIDIKSNIKYNDSLINRVYWWNIIAHVSQHFIRLFDVIQSDPRNKKLVSIDKIVRCWRDIKSLSKRMLAGEVWCDLVSIWDNVCLLTRIEVYWCFIEITTSSDAKGSPLLPINKCWMLCSLSVMQTSFMLTYCFRA